MSVLLHGYLFRNNKCPSLEMKAASLAPGAANFSHMMHLVIIPVTVNQVRLYLAAFKILHNKRLCLISFDLLGYYCVCDLGGRERPERREPTYRLGRWPATGLCFFSGRTAYSVPSLALRCAGLPSCASQPQ